MFKKGIIGKRTNHSFCASSATRLYDKCVNEQLICKKIGNSSVAVRSYKCTSSQHLKEVCNVLYGNMKGKEKSIKEPEPNPQ